LLKNRVRRQQFDRRKTVCAAAFRLRKLSWNTRTKFVNFVNEFINFSADNNDALFITCLIYRVSGFLN